MKIPKNYDVVGKDAISPDKGLNFTENPGIDPSIKAVAMTPGEKATNDTAGLEYTKAQPYGKGGSGYTKNN